MKTLNIKKITNKNFYLTLIYFLFYTYNILAYQPLKWSPMDSYIVGGGKNISFPKSMQNFNAKEKLTQTVTFEYNNEGKLILEKYYNNKNEYTGYTKYFYQNKILKEEKLYDKNDNLLNSTSFTNDNKNITSLTIKNKKNEIISEQKFFYEKGLLNSGYEKSNGNKDEFKIVYVKNQIKEIILTNTTSGKLGDIIFKYNEKKQLIERVRNLILEKETNRFVYYYDQLGFIKNYSYEKLIRKTNTWIKERKIVLLY